MFYVSQVCVLVKNLKIWINSDTINVINVKLCLMALLIDFYLSIQLSVTMTMYQVHSNAEQLTENFVFLSS